jgi:transcriptional regulator with XRE-family HTH domain
MTDSFGARLRAARERSQVGLDAIAHRTKINKALFEALERDDASRWPTGIFRRAFIRAYAEAIGIDPEPIVAEFLTRFPDPSGEARPSTPHARRSPAWREQPAEGAALRLTLADDPAASRRARRRALSGWSKRALAAACDMGVVVAIAALVAIAAGRFSTVLAIAMACYFGGGVLVFGSSPGAWVIGRRRALARIAATDPHRRVLTGRFDTHRTRHAPQEPATHPVEPVRLVVRNR